MSQKLRGYESYDASKKFSNLVFQKLQGFRSYEGFVGLLLRIFPLVPKVTRLQGYGRNFCQIHPRILPLLVTFVCFCICLFVSFFWWQLGLDDGSAVDKQVLLSWTGSTRSRQVSAASPDRTGFARTERVQVRRTKQVADFAWENVAAAAAVADFPSLVLLEAAAVQASHITSYAHRSARHGAPVPALHMPRPRTGTASSPSDRH